MDYGISQNLKGNIIQGNLSIEPNLNPNIQGDGSIELSGKLYIDTITQYNNNSQGLLLQNVLFQNNYIYIPHNTPSTFFTSGALVSEGGITIKNTTNATNTSSGGGMTIFGGLSVVANSFFGKSINVGGNIIRNHPLPEIDTDVVNKLYVDSLVSSFTSSNLSGNFSQGQVIIGGINGELNGYDSLTYTNGSLTLSSTQNSLGLGSGGNLTLFGGASISGSTFFGQNVDVGMNRITHVDDPVNDTDAINKRYLQNLFADCSFYGTGSDSLLEKTLTLTPGTNEITQLVFDSTVIKAFKILIYIQQIDGNSAIYTIAGFYNDLDEIWSINYTWQGNIGNQVQFSINTSGTIGQIQYTLSSTPDEYYIKYRALSLLDITNESYNVIVLDNNILAPTFALSKPVLSLAFKIIGIINNETSWALFILTALNKGTTWILNSEFTGDVTDVNFTINTQGDIYYTNTGNVNTTMLEYIIQVNIPQGTFLELPAGSLDVQEPFPEFDSNQYKSFYLNLYIQDTLNTKYALYEIYGIYNTTNNSWIISISNIGDNYITFTTNTIDGIGKLAYTTSVDAQIRFDYNSPSHFIPLCVTKGGTGNNNFPPNRVLLGNNLGAIKTTNKLSYTDTLNIAGGIKVTDGNIDLSLNRITSVGNPIGDTDAVNKRYLLNLFNCSNISENSGYELNLELNESSESIVPQLIYDSDITRAFIALVYVYIDTESAVYILNGYSNNGSWVLQYSWSGFPFTELSFEITSLGQIIYTLTSSETVNIKYRKFINLDTISIDYVNTSLPDSPVYTPTGLTIPGDTLAFKSLHLVESGGNWALYTLYGLKKSSGWILAVSSVGYPPGVSFSINSSNGQIMYTSQNAFTLDYTVPIEISGNTFIELPESGIMTLFPSSFPDFDASKSLSFYLNLYIKGQESNSTVFYEIYGNYNTSLAEWTINTSFIGDIIMTLDISNGNIPGIGKLQYTCSESLELLFNYDIPVEYFDPICVTKGGTGTGSHVQDGVLIGNGIGAIKSSDNLTFTDDTLVINGNLIVSGANLAPNSGESQSNTMVSALNNQSGPTSTSVSFNPEIVKAIVMYIAVTVITASTDYDSLYDIYCVNKGLGNPWILYSSFRGDFCGIDFSLNTSGELLYTSSDKPNWINTEMRFNIKTIEY